MIDEKQVNELLALSLAVPDKEIGRLVTDMDWDFINKIYENRADLIRLARLGLWAERLAIPALKQYINILPPNIAVDINDNVRYGEQKPVALEALMAIPKDEK